MLAHDLVEQLLQHRIDEIKFSQQGFDFKTFTERIVKHLVTPIEKAAFKTYFPGVSFGGKIPLELGSITWFEELEGSSEYIISTEDLNY